MVKQDSMSKSKTRFVVGNVESWSEAAAEALQQQQTTTHGLELGMGGLSLRSGSLDSTADSSSSGYRGALTSSEVSYINSSGDDEGTKPGLLSPLEPLIHQSSASSYEYAQGHYGHGHGHGGEGMIPLIEDSDKWIGLPKYGTFIPNRVFIGGISPMTTEAELQFALKPYGNIQGAKIITDRFGMSKGYGFVTFTSDLEARNLYTGMLKKTLPPIIIHERRLNIAPAVKRAVPTRPALFPPGPMWNCGGGGGEPYPPGGPGQNSMSSNSDQYSPYLTTNGSTSSASIPKSLHNNNNNPGFPFQFQSIKGSTPHHHHLQPVQIPVVPSQYFSTSGPHHHQYQLSTATTTGQPPIPSYTTFGIYPAHPLPQQQNTNNGIESGSGGGGEVMSPYYATGGMEFIYPQQNYGLDFCSSGGGGAPPPPYLPASTITPIYSTTSFQTPMTPIQFDPQQMQQQQGFGLGGIVGGPPPPQYFNFAELPTFFSN